MGGEGIVQKPGICQSLPLQTILMEQRVRIQSYLALHQRQAPKEQKRGGQGGHRQQQRAPWGRGKGVGGGGAE